jgi:hypothetical protein
MKLVLFFSAFFLSISASSLDQPYAQPDSFQILLESYRMIFPEAPQRKLLEHQHAPNIAQQEVFEALQEIKNGLRQNVISRDVLMRSALNIILNWAEVLGAGACTL